MLLLLLMLHTAWNMQNTQSHAFGCYRLPDPLDGMHTYAVLGIYINFMLLLLLLLHDVKSNYYIPHPGQMPNALTVWMPYLYAW